MKYNWKPVIKSFFTIALKHGFTLHTVDNGYGNVAVNTIKEAVEEVNATDESSTYLKHPNGSHVWFHIVLGNSPEETICDYIVNDLADKVHKEFSAKWEGKECPTIKN